MIDEYTPRHAAAFFGRTESVKMILDCLTADSSTVAAADYHQIRDADWSIQIFS